MNAYIRVESCIMCVDLWPILRYRLQSVHARLRRTSRQINHKLGSDAQTFFCVLILALSRAIVLVRNFRKESNFINKILYRDIENDIWFFLEKKIIKHSFTKLETLKTQSSKDSRAIYFNIRITIRRWIWFFYFFTSDRITVGPSPRLFSLR